MNITYFHWSKQCGVSINRSFYNLINLLSQEKDINVVQYHVPYAGSNPLNLLRNIWFVFKHRDKNGINHITGDIHYCILGLIGVKSMLTIHDDYSYKQARFGRIGKIYKKIFWIYLPIKLADSVLCITESTRDKIKRIYNSPKLQVLSNHTWPPEYHYYPQRFNKNKVTVLHISTGENKNLETTIQALKGIPSRLIVVEKMKASQISMAEESGIEYINTERVTDSEMLELYKQADIISFPSSYEGFGMPIVEGQLIGRIVVTTNKSPMNWVAGDGAYFIQDPHNIQEMRNAICTIINNEKLRNTYIQKGLLNAQRFSGDKIKRQFIQLYKRLIDLP